MPAGPVTALARRVDSQIDAGDYVAITGPSGCGKSTLLHILGCVDAPSAGSLMFEGRDVGALSESERSRIRLTRIGFVFQRFFLLPMLTAWENIELPQAEAGAAKADAARAHARAARLCRPRRAQRPPAVAAVGRRDAARGDCARAGEPARRCCSPTSRPASSTRTPASRSPRCSIASTPTAPRSSSSPTIRRWRRARGRHLAMKSGRVVTRMILRLALRSLATRPVRTAVLACGLRLRHRGDGGAARRRRRDSRAGAFAGARRRRRRRRQRAVRRRSKTRAS